MAITSTTLSAAVTVGDNSITVASATGFAAGSIIQVDSETMQVAKGYVSGTAISVKRGWDGTATQAHASGAQVTVMLPSDASGPAPQTDTQFPVAHRAREIASYAASGAITLPRQGADMVAFVQGTSALAMTIAAPTNDLNGSVLYVIGGGKSASTLTFTGGIGLAGTSYDVLTLQTGGQVGITAMACNGAWVALNGPITGTSTALSGGIA